MTDASKYSKQTSLLVTPVPETIKVTIEERKSELKKGNLKFDWNKKIRRCLWAVPLIAAVIATMVVVAILRPNPEKTDGQADSRQLSDSSSFTAMKAVKRSHTVFNKEIVLSNANPSDFQISEDISNLHIKSVADSEQNYFPTDNKKNPFIRNVTISCGLTEDWMVFIFTKFPQVEYLTFYEDDICNNKLQENPKNGFRSIRLPNLETLVVANAKNDCPFIELVLDSLKTSSLKHLKISSSSITYSFFQHFFSFLENARETVETIEIGETYLCPACEVMSVPYQKLRKLSIRRSKMDYI